MTVSRSNALASWDVDKQQRYRRQHPEDTCIFHMLLDGSGSMHEHQTALRRSYNLYLEWIRRHGPPMSLLDVRCFGSTLQERHPQALGLAQVLTPETYDATWGGTALYDALGDVITQSSEPGQHILIVFTDGQDGDSRRWSPGQVHELLQTMQTASGWLAVFLGAFLQAFDVGRALGFAEGNCLVFGTERIPEAFERLRRATETFLLASPPARKLLAQNGVFTHSPERTTP